MPSEKIKLPLDLSYLYEISDDDREFIYEMIRTIVNNTPPILKEIKEAGEKEKWTELGRLLHKFKPSLLLLNIDYLSTLIRSAENNAKKENNIEDIPSQLIELNQLCEILLKELNDLIETDRY
jgi:HPt (histidine-containing phosphotransfer) domain-containing protein